MAKDILFKVDLINKSPVDFDFTLFGENFTRKANIGNVTIYGPELVTDGGFDNPAAWNIGPGWQVSNGTAKFSGTGLGEISQNIGAIANQMYDYEFDILNFSFTTFTMFAQYIGGTTGIVAAPPSPVGHKTSRSSAAGFDTLVRLGFYFNLFNANQSIEIDNLSVRQVSTMPGLIVKAPVDIDRLNQEVNSGGFKVNELKLISLSPDSLADPIILNNTSLTGRKAQSPSFPIDKFGSSFYQNIITLNSKDLDNFTAGVANSLRVKIKANSELYMIFRGQLFRSSDILLNKKKMEYYE